MPSQSEKIVWSLGGEWKVRHLEEGENAKTVFYTLKNEIIDQQKQTKQSAYILVDDVIYEISPSVGHQKLSGDTAKRLKRDAKSFLAYFC